MSAVQITVKSNVAQQTIRQIEELERQRAKAVQIAADLAAATPGYGQHTTRFSSSAASRGFAI